MAGDNIIELVVRATDDATKQLESIGGSLTELGGHADFARNALLGIAEAFSLKEMIDTIDSAQEATAELNVGFAAAAATVGVTRQQMDDYAESLANTTTFSKVAVEQAESLLLTFSNIRGDNFGRALQDSADLAARSGRDLSSVVLALGRALQNPAEGMQLLQRMGVSLSDTQKDQVTHFLELNDTASAQEIILKRVEDSYKGSAEVMTGTLGGALTQLKNKFEELFELNSGETSGLIKAVEDIKKEITDPEFINGIHAITDAMISGLAHVAQLLAEVAAGWGKIFEWLNDPRLASWGALGTGIQKGINDSENQRDLQTTNNEERAAASGAERIRDIDTGVPVKPEGLVDKVNDWSWGVENQPTPGISDYTKDPRYIADLKMANELAEQVIAKVTAIEKPLEDPTADSKAKLSATSKLIDQDGDLLASSHAPNTEVTEQAKKYQEELAEDRIKTAEDAALAVLAVDNDLAKQQKDLGEITNAQLLAQQQTLADQEFQVKVKALEDFLAYQQSHGATLVDQEKTRQAIRSEQQTYAQGTEQRSVQQQQEPVLDQRAVSQATVSAFDKFEDPLTKLKSEYAEYTSYLQQALQQYQQATDATSADGQLRIASMQDAIARALEQEREALQKLAATMDSPEAQKAHDDIQKLWDGMFDHIQGGIKGMEQSFLKALQSMLNQALATDLWKALGLDSLIGAGTKGQTTVGGSLLGGFSGILGGLFSSIFGGGSGGAAGATQAVSTTGGAEVGSDLLAAVAGFAAGGGDREGLTWVGEGGPELVDLPGGSHVYSHSDSNQYANSTGGGGQQIHFNPVNNVNITASDADSTKAQLISYIDYTNKQQNAELMRTMYRNGLGRMK